MLCCRCVVTEYYDDDQSGTIAIPFMMNTPKLETASPPYRHSNIDNANSSYLHPNFENSSPPFVHLGLDNGNSVHIPPNVDNASPSFRTPGPPPSTKNSSPSLLTPTPLNAEKASPVFTQLDVNANNSTLIPSH